MKNKNIKFVLIALLVMVCIYFGYKGFNLFYYNINNITTDNYEEFVDGLKIIDTISIKTEKLDDSQYLAFKDMKIKNDFSNFKKLENQSYENSIKYVLYDEKENIKASIWMSEVDSYVDMIKKDKTLFGTEDKRITNDDLTKFLEKNNINNDIDLFKYLEKNKSTKNNIFTSVKQMKDNFKMQFIASIAMPAAANITLIEGDYTGYILNLSNAKEVSIIKDEKRYVFTFLKTDYFTDDYIKTLINTIVID